MRRPISSRARGRRGFRHCRARFMKSIERRMSVSERRVGFGVIGLGSISRYHVKGLVEAADCARVVAVCDTSPGAAERVGSETGAKAYTDYRELLKDPNVEAVDLPLPHHLHYEVANRALEAGKHVLVEKPM